MLRHHVQMTNDLITALAVFAFASSITPGPNNLRLLASGANFGFRRSLPHMFGISLGHMFMVALMGAGLIQIFTLLPWLHVVFKVLAVLYMAWLAWKIAHTAAPKGGETSGRPLTFLQAAAFQWVNPKAWAMAITAVTVYTPEQTLTTVAIVCAVFAGVNFPSVGVWTLLGQKVALILTSHRRLVWFNRTMAVLLLGSLYPVITA